MFYSSSCPARTSTGDPPSAHIEVHASKASNVNTPDTCRPHVKSTPSVLASSQAVPTFTHHVRHYLNGAKSPGSSNEAHRSDRCDQDPRSGAPVVINTHRSLRSANTSLGQANGGLLCFDHGQTGLADRGGMNSSWVSRMVLGCFVLRRPWFWIYKEAVPKFKFDPDIGDVRIGDQLLQSSVCAPLVLPVSHARRSLAVRAAPQPFQAELARQGVALLAPVRWYTTPWRALTAKLEVGTTAAGLKDKPVFSGLFATSTAHTVFKGPK